MAWHHWGHDSDFPIAKFHGGRVDLNIVNHLNEPVKLLVRCSSLPCSNVPLATDVDHPRSVGTVLFSP
jgi:hypothetical protein